MITNDIIKWLEKYDTEYNTNTQVLHINKAIPVKEFITLKRLIEPYRFKVKDIIIEGR